MLAGGREGGGKEGGREVYIIGVSEGEKQSTSERGRAHRELAKGFREESAALIAHDIIAQIEGMEDTSTAPQALAQALDADG